MSCAVVVAVALIQLSGITQTHADRLATPICDVSPSVEEALLLAVTLDAEGGVRPAVMRCDVLGDHGHAFGGYQLHRWHISGPVRDFCKDPRLQATCARRALSFGDTVRARIARFMGRRQKDHEVSRRVTRYERVMQYANDAPAG